MVNHHKIQEAIEQEKIRIKRQDNEKHVKDQSLLAEAFNIFKNVVNRLLSEDICDELQLVFEAKIIENSKSIHSNFYAIIPIDDRRRLELTSSDNHLWWLGVVAFHHDKFLHRDIKDASEGYWYESNELKERVLTRYEELTYLRKL